MSLPTSTPRTHVHGNTTTHQPPSTKGKAISTNTTTMSLTDTIARELELGTAPKVYSTGSVGLFFSGKIVGEGRRYQATLTATVIGSKDDPRAKAPKAAAVPTVVADVVAGLLPKEFKPKDGIDRPGFGSYGKVVADGQRFTYSLNVVPIV